MARIDLVDLAHSYAGNDAPPASFALKPVTMTWRQGGAYALLGPSGCGKTTLLNLISGIVTPSRGKILFDGADITQATTQTPACTRRQPRWFQRVRSATADHITQRRQSGTPVRPMASRKISSASSELTSGTSWRWSWSRAASVWRP